jgi:hypothetical protein
MMKIQCLVCTCVTIVITNHNAGTPGIPLTRPLDKRIQLGEVKLLGKNCQMHSEWNRILQYYVWVRVR